MKTVNLKSIPSTDQGTFGEIFLPDGTKYFTLELPWENNKNGESCVPAGKYLCKFINSPKHGPTYQLQDVPGRSYVQIHAANYAGDTKDGFRSDLLGCIALGTSIGILNRQLVVLNSTKTVEEFERKMEQQDFYLVIERS